MTIDIPTQTVAPVLTDDEAVLAAARIFADRVRPGAVERDTSGEPPVELLRDLAGTGILAMNVPREHGGPGVSRRTVAEVFRTLAVADSAIAQVPQNHTHHLELVARYGTDSQKKLWFGAVLAGARLGNATSERGGKTPIDLSTTVARDVNGTLRLNGRKYYSTGALTAQWVPVMAHDDAGRIVTVIVPRDSDGLAAEHDWTAFGQRATISGTVVLDDVAVEDEWVLNVSSELSQQPNIVAAIGQLIHAAIDVGIAEAAVNDVAIFLRDRARPWFEAGVDKAADDPLALVQMGDVVTRSRAAVALLHAAADALDHATRTPTAETIADARIAVAHARAFSAETAVDVSSRAIDVLGSSASDRSHGLDRHWRNARTHTLHDPTRWKLHLIGDHAVNGTVPSASTITV